MGITRHLNTVSKIIKRKDALLYRHPKKLQAEECFFVYIYRMVVIIFRRELTFKKIVCLWKVILANQVAIMVGLNLMDEEQEATEVVGLYCCWRSSRSIVDCEAPS